MLLDVAKISLFVKSEMPTSLLFAELPQIFNGKSTLRFAEHGVIVKLRSIQNPEIFHMLCRHQFIFIF